MEGKKIQIASTENIKIGEIWEETEERFKDQAWPFVTAFLIDRKIKFINAKELMNITEESICDFLSRDPECGYWFPERWAEEVIKNFDNNEVFYFDKLIQEKSDAYRST